MPAPGARTPPPEDPAGAPGGVFAGHEACGRRPTVVGVTVTGTAPACRGEGGTSSVPAGPAGPPSGPRAWVQETEQPVTAGAVLPPFAVKPKLVEAPAASEPLWAAFLTVTVLPLVLVTPFHSETTV